MAASLVRSPVGPVATADVLGIEYFAGSLEDAAALVLGRVLARRGGYASLCGVHGVILAQHRPSLMAALRSSWMTFPDGAPVAWLMRRTGADAARRVAGPDLMPRLIDLGQAHGVRHYFLGSTTDVLDALRRGIERRWPDAVIAGMTSPPFRELRPDEREALLAEIRSSEPDVVWVGLGLPKQDEWMHEHARALHPAVVLGVGAAFDFEARTKARAPLWMQRAGLEWFHRLCCEPRRLARRYATTNTEFVVRAGFLLARAQARRVVRRSAPS